MGNGMTVVLPLMWATAWMVSPVRVIQPLAVRLVGS